MEITGFELTIWLQSEFRSDLAVAGQVINVWERKEYTGDYNINADIYSFWDFWGEQCRERD